MDKLYDVTILGEDWIIVEDDEEENPRLKDCDGYTDVSVKKIVIDNFAHVDNDRCLEDMNKYRKKVIRHEIVHAFLIESGLDGSSLESESWARNEEMVDWFARQSPKIFKIMQEIDCLGFTWPEDAIRNLPSAQPEVKEIGYAECANAMLKMWIDNVLTDGEYNRIMDKLNTHHDAERRKDE